VPPLADAQKTPRAPRDPAAAYERQKERSRDRQREQSEKGRDLEGRIPAVVDPERRARALASMAAFYDYFPHRFSLPFCADGLTVRDRLEGCINAGGMFPLVMPRGSGKTSQVIAAALYAIFSGKHAYVVPVGANAKKAKNLLRSMKAEIRSNPLLMEDFPEICLPVREVSASPNKCASQHYGGKPTDVAWGTYEIVLPNVPGSPAPNAIVTAASIRSADLRGLQYTRPSDGAVVRPSLVLPDDIQDEKVARNPARVDETIELLEGAIEGMAGPGKSLSVVALLTVIEANDVADTLSDRKKKPRWAGQKFKMLYAFPEDMKAWEEYGHLRAESFRRGGKGEEATAYYAARREQMDRGAEVAWRERFKPDELSGLQHAMNIFLDKPDVFWREYQNEPRAKAELAAQLRREDLLDRTNGIERGTAPLWATHLTAFVDVQQSLLYFLVAAWADDFTGAVVDCGAWPEQDRRHFTLADAPRPFARVPELAAAGVEGSVRFALQKCVGENLRNRAYPKEGGGTLLLDRVLVDVGFLPDVVAEWIRAAGPGPVVMGARGLGIGAKKKPLSEYHKKPGERYGFHWRVPNPQETRGVRTLQVDSNFWKSRLAGQLRLAVGDRGAVSFFGRPGADHRMLADHLTAELARPQTDEISGRTVDEWELRPGKPDNHWWDCLVGAAAAASLLGATLGSAKPKPEKKARVRLPYEEWAKKRFGGQA
jgi:hypothetical protein